jgi:hypothetical protein
MICGHSQRRQSTTAETRAERTPTWAVHRCGCGLSNSSVCERSHYGSASAADRVTRELRCPRVAARWQGDPVYELTPRRNVLEVSWVDDRWRCRLVAVSRADGRRG